MSAISAKAPGSTASPPKRSAKETTPWGSETVPRMRARSPGRSWAIQLTSVDPPPMSNSSTRGNAGSRSGVQPSSVSRASASGVIGSSASPVSDSTRARNAGPLAARRQASVATPRTFRTRAPRSLPAQTFNALTARRMAGSESRPLALRPSPSRTTRENEPTTRKLRPGAGSAISMRQLWVPRSTAP